MCKVSILVPVYNVSKYIERCARSLFEQTFTDIEFIFVNDCTPDDSIGKLNRILSHYPNVNVKIITHTRNKGLAAARNTAIQNSSGEYIFHVDSDDYLELNTIQLLYEKVAYSNADLVLSDYRIIYSDHNKILKTNYTPDPQEYTKLLLKRRSIPNIIGKLIKRSIIIDNKLFSIAGLNQGEDYLITPKVAYCSHIIEYVPQPLYNYVKNIPTSYTSNVNLNAVKCIEKVEDNLVSYFSNIPNFKNFASTIILSKLYNKIALLYASDKSCYKYIAGLYKDIKYWNTDLKLQHKSLLLFMDCHCYSFVYSVLRMVKKLRKE
ncbi:MAG: glycosyltransferase [Oscillibacter sp.]|nr:glycosyltransferase [Oscillibacter sp.]